MSGACPRPRAPGARLETASAPRPHVGPRSAGRAAARRRARRPGEAGVAAAASGTRAEPTGLRRRGARTSASGGRRWRPRCRVPGLRASAPVSFVARVPAGSGRWGARGPPSRFLPAPSLEQPRRPALSAHRRGPAADTPAPPTRASQPAARRPRSGVDGGDHWPGFRLRGTEFPGSELTGMGLCSEHSRGRRRLLDVAVAMLRSRWAAVQLVGSHRSGAFSHARSRQGQLAGAGLCVVSWVRLL